MIRQILCEQCKDKRRGTHPEDFLAGWRSRVIQIRTKKPAEHTRTTTVVDDKGHKHVTKEHLPSIVCDHCSTPIGDGTAAFAVTSWNSNREGEPGPWEKDYSE